MVCSYKSSPIQAIIWNCLNHYFYEDAIFLSECYFSEVGGDAALFLLATSYFRSGQVMSAYLLLRKHGVHTTETKFLYAKCCYDLDKMAEAEQLMSMDIVAKQNIHGIKVEENSPAYPFLIYLLAQICKKTARREKAVEFYKRCLQKFPFMFSACSEICWLGENLNMDETFGESHIFEFNKLFLSCITPLNYKLMPAPKECLAKYVSSNSTSTPSLSVITELEHDVTFEDSKKIEDVNDQLLGSTPSPLRLSDSVPARQELNSRSIDTSRSKTPYTDIEDIDILQSMVPNAPHKAPRKLGSRRAQSDLESIKYVDSVAYVASLPTKPCNYVPPNVLSQNQLQHPTRRSTRLLQLSVKENSNTLSRDLKATKQHLNRKVARKPKTIDSFGKLEDKNKFMPEKKMRTDIKQAAPAVPISKESNQTEKKSLCENCRCPLQTPLSESSVSCSEMLVDNGDSCSISEIIEIMRKYAEVELALSQFDCAKVLELTSNLPERHVCSGWALCARARAFFELAEYDKACEVYERSRQLSEHFVHGMELYSTALFQLRREVDLSALSQWFTERFSYAPEAWCIAGNCFSHQKDHETAIKFFKRSIQLNKDFAYAYCLLGHEYLAQDQIEQAEQCFRSAIRVYPRHYNAWYGIGLLYYKQEKYQLAEHYYRKALKINPRNALLMSHVSAALQAQQRLDEAMIELDRALALSPRIAICRYRRAQVLFAQDQLKETLQEIEQLKQLVPREADIYYLAGKVYKKLGEHHLALMHFSWATDLDPRGSRQPDDQPVTALASMDPDDVGVVQAMDSDESY